VHAAGVARDHARDLRFGGTWTALQRAKNDVIWAAALAALASTRRLPLDALRGLGRALGRAAHLGAGGARATALANVARVFPEWDDDARRRFVKRSFVTLGEALGETVALLRPGSVPPLPLTGHTIPLLTRARAEGRGVVFVSAHLGPWERVAAAIVAAGFPLSTLARESYDPRFTRLYARLRAAHGVGVVWRSHPGAAARILRTLRSGGLLGVPMDLRSRVASRAASGPASRVACCAVPFLGVSTLTPVGPARIALRSRAAVVVGTAARAGQPEATSSPNPNAPRAGPCLGPLVVTATRIPTDDLPCDEVGACELTARINGELSRRILAMPHAWAWMHPRWDNP
jgi:KDO2-lipid IV(A) lauroyltransferase